MPAGALFQLDSGFAFGPPEVLQAAPDLPTRREDVGQALTTERSAAYIPTLPVVAMGYDSGYDGAYLPGQFFGDVLRMVEHPAVKGPLGYYRSGCANPEFEAEASGEAEKAFALAETEAFWDRSLSRAQLSYEYGWVGCEALYRVENGRHHFDGLHPFAPQDVRPITHEGKIVGVRVANLVNDAQQQGVTLWVSKKIPSKGFWHAHQPKYHPWFGRSQLSSGWRPWRRLATRDAAEEVIDGAVYRAGYQGPQIFYPPGASQATRQQPGGDPRVDNRDVATQAAARIKAGGSFTFPNFPGPDGKPAWRVEWDRTVVDVGPLIEHVKYLKDEISLGIGVAPELLQASEVGSGYSGRAIPLEGFYLQQQEVAGAILESFLQQILLPLIRWNFGPRAWARVSLKSLLETRLKQNQAAGGKGAPAKEPAPGDNASDDGPPSRGARPLPTAGQVSQGSSGGLSRGRGTGGLVKLGPGPHKYASTQFNLEGGLARAIVEFGRTIPDTELATEGREPEPHITCLYGLHADDASEVGAVVDGLAPVVARLGPVEVFEAGKGGEADVVYVSVLSPDLHRLNARLRELKHTDTYPEYVPHVCVAYVKPGEGRKYLGLRPFDGAVVSLDTLTFSPSFGATTDIPLAGDRPELAMASARWLATDATGHAHKGKGEGGGQFTGDGGGTAVADKPKAAKPSLPARIAAKAKAAEHQAKTLISKGVDKLPDGLPKAARKAFQLSMVTYSAGYAAAQAAAESRGLEESQVQKVAQFLALGDLVGMKAFPALLAASGLGGGAAAAGSFVPVASLCYLGYSMARQPTATLNAAKAAIKAVRKATNLATAHAPAGGVTVQGQKYVGGEFIPGDVMAQATAAEKAAVAGEDKPADQTGGELAPVAKVGEPHTYVAAAAKQAASEFTQALVRSYRNKADANDDRLSETHAAVLGVTEYTKRKSRAHDKAVDEMNKVWLANEEELNRPGAKAPPEVQAAADKCDKAMHDYLTAKRNEGDRAWAAIKKAVNHPHAIGYQGTQPVKKVELRQATDDGQTTLNLGQREAIKEVEKRLSGSISGMHRQAIQYVTVYQVPEGEKQRAYYAGERHNREDSGIYLPGHTSARTVMHELGHALETNYRVHEAARGFLYHRVGDEEAKPMGEGYEAYEVGRDDKFGDAFGPSARYVGKHYKSEDTEVVSMGLEKLFDDPVNFARYDPEYFKFVVGVLDGTYA